MTPTTTDRDPVPPRAVACADCGTTGGSPLTGPSSPRRRRGYCDRCYQRHQRDRDITFRYVDQYLQAPIRIPAGRAPILRPDPTLPIWTGLAVAKYSTPTWHTYRPEDRHLTRAAWERQLDKAA